MKRRQILIASIAVLLASTPVLAQMSELQSLGRGRRAQRPQDATPPAEPAAAEEHQRPRQHPRRYGQSCYMNGMKPRHRRHRFWDKG